MSRLLRRQALSIFRAALAAADPVDAVVRHLRSRDYSRFRHIYAIGAGKAGASMALAAERVLGRRITAGLLNVKYGNTAKLRRIELNPCGHPLPDEPGVAGSTRIAEIAAQAGEGDLVLCLISGGASALLPLPADPITLAEKQATTQLLLSCAANIHEINCVRKHLSRIKGGQLARLATPAAVESLLLSDVIGDDLDVIGSGPTAPDASTFAGALAILEKFDLLERVPAAVRLRLDRGARGELPETPKPGDRLFRGVRNVLVGNNRLALDAAAARARALGFRTLVLSSEIQGETREIARMHAAIAREIVSTSRPVKAPACIITGGETTVTLHGDGLGGRNQEFVLAAALEIAGLRHVVVLSAGTDGSDGPTDAAGAFASATVLAEAEAAGLSLAAHLGDNNSYAYFDAIGRLLKTGPTMTNVCDLQIAIIR